MIAQVFDNRLCSLGEGPLWHPHRNQFFWFDILNKKLLSRQNDELYEWQFEEYVSAAGWVDTDNLLIASQSQLFKFNVATNERQNICALEADNLITRSNDGRADPYGGFWIGTMGINEEKNAGAIYRFYKGELRKLYSNITVSNAICFSPDAKFGYYTDTSTQQIMRQPLDAAGWPQGSPTVFIDLGADGFYPDGAVIDSEGALWNAQWGAGRVARYLPDGSLDFTIKVNGTNTTCPAFGGESLTDLYITTARKNIENPNNEQGATYIAKTNVLGQKEHQVFL